MKQKQIRVGSDGNDSNAPSHGVPFCPHRHPPSPPVILAPGLVNYNILVVQ